MGDGADSARTLTKMMHPEPGRPRSLGQDQDLADATDLLAVLRAVRAQNAAQVTRRADRVAREALWWMWEQRRLPPLLIRSKYPRSYPWSSAARAAFAQLEDNGLSGGQLRGVIIEHLIPWGITVRKAVDDSRALDPAALVDLLSAHGAAAVLTVEEDKLLSKAGLANRMPDHWDGTDLWARARTAGISLSGFAP